MTVLPSVDGPLRLDLDDPLPSGPVLVLGDGALGRLVAPAFARGGWDVHRVPRRWIAGLRGALAGASLVVSTVPDDELATERAVLEHGGTLVSPVPRAPDVVRALRACVTEPRGTVLVNAGLAPGVTNLAAAELVARRPDADAVEIVRTLSTHATRGRAGAARVHRELRAAAHHAVAPVPLPAPFGERCCVRVGDDDRGGLDAAADGLDVRSYICLTEPAAHGLLLALNAVAAMRALPRFLLGPAGRRTASPPSRESIAHWVAALRGRERLAAWTIEGQGEYAAAAAAVTVFGTALLERAALQPGVHLPEDVFTLDELAAGLWGAGLDLVHHRL